MGILGNHVLSITVAASVVSGATAFSIFIGTSSLIGGLSKKFIPGIDATLLLSLVLLIIVGALSFARGKENRTSPQAAHISPKDLR